MHDRVVTTVIDPGARALGAAPVGPLDLSPPWRGLNAAGGRKVVWKQAGEHERPAESLGFGDMPGRIHEASELGGRYRARLDPEGVEPDPAERPLPVVGVGEAIGAAHEELAGVERHPPVALSVHRASVRRAAIRARLSLRSGEVPGTKGRNGVKS